jgi:hypothetical protein
MSLDIRFKEKIQQLRQRFFDAEPQAISQINQWEQDIQRLSQISDFVNLAPVQVINRLVRERIKGIMIEKATKGTNDVLDSREKELRYILELFNPHYEQELSSIEHLIDNELL